MHFFYITTCRDLYIIQFCLSPHSYCTPLSDPFNLTARGQSEERLTVNMTNLQAYATKFTLTQEVDDALVVCRKQTDCIFEEKHEGCIDYTISQFIGIDLEER